METSLRALLTAVVLVLVSAGLTFGQVVNEGNRLPGVTTADSIQRVQETSTASPLTLWGIDPNWNGHNWHLTVTDNGDSANFNGPALGTYVGPSAGWVAVRGAFKHPLVGNTTSSGAIVVSGLVTFVGEAPDVGSGMRYGIYNTLNPGVLTGVSSDSAYWKGMSTAAYGYTISPQSGFDETDQWCDPWCSPSQWVNMGGDWLSPYSGAIGIGPAVVQQVPALATMNPGTYDFAFSVHPKPNGTRVFKYYLIQKESAGTTVYWNAATFTDTTLQTRTDTLNSIEFGCEGGPNMTGVIFSNVVDSLGPDLSIPAPPWQAYYVNRDSFAFYGGRTGGWSLIPGGSYGPQSLPGNATVYGDTSIPLYQSMAVRAAFNGEVAPRGIDSNVVVTGDLEFDGGGFGAPNSFMFGLFDADSAGSVNETDAAHYAWTGTERANNGYLFIPPSGTNAMPQWPGGPTSQYMTGDAGAVVNGVWLRTVNSRNYMLADSPQYPKDAIAHRGMYHFAIWVGPNAQGTQEVNYEIYSEPDTNKYVWQGKITDTHSPVTASQFNSIDFALLGGNSTDTLKIENVHVNLGPAVPMLAGKYLGVTNTTSNLPKTFALYQDYPNPFNPTTVISYRLSAVSHVTLTVYDVLGRRVKTLVDQVESPGSHKVTFNAAGLASGVYFYRLSAEPSSGTRAGFVRTMRMLLLK